MTDQEATSLCEQAACPDHRREPNPDMAHICPECEHGTGIVRDDHVLICARCSYEWRVCDES